MKKILVVCPTKRDRFELSQVPFTSEYTVHFHNYDDMQLEKIMCVGAGWFTKTFDPAMVIQDMSNLCKAQQIDAVVSTDDYPGSIFASIIAQEAGLIGPHPESVLVSQHKYYARLAQQASVPEATPAFTLVDPHAFEEHTFALPFPLFIKPVKSFFSVYANVATSLPELSSLLQTSRLPTGFLHQFNWFLQEYSSCELPANYLLAEELLSGVQVTLDGYVYNGVVVCIGIVDSVMFPGTICFSRFVYPSHLPMHVQERMATIAQRYMRATNFDNGLFNIEFMYNPETDALHIIEVNPRMASQFADIYEKVDGTNLYSILLNIALGIEPQLMRKQGKHGCAASLVLRTFDNKLVTKVPDAAAVECILQEFPDARVYTFVNVGEKLSDAFQDGKSFRYGLIHLGGQDEQDVLEKFEWCKQVLDFQFTDIN